MTTASQTIRSLFAACGLLAVVACGDDAGSDDRAAEGDAAAPVADAAHDASHDDASHEGHDDASLGGGHAHGGSDASVTDASVVDAAPDPSCTATISLQDFKLVPADVSVTAGKVTLCARNDGRSPHDLALRLGDTALGKTETLNPGESGRFEVTLQAGSYTQFCSLAGHESLGMKGTLTAR